MQNVSEQIKVASNGGKVLVTMNFDNRGSKPVHVPKAVAKDGEVLGKHFALTEAATGQEVPYIGPMIKRGPLGPDDYIVVAPKAQHAATLDITRAYEFLPGEHTYQLRYEGNYVANLKQVTAVTPVQIAPVSFTHTRQ